MNSASKLMVLVSLVAYAGFAGAQETQSEPVLEEVVVTAQKRETSLQETPISITAFSGDMIERMQVRDGLSLSGYVPNLSIGARRNELLVNIRGIQSNNTTEVGDPAAAVHLDGVYLSRPRGAAALFYDVERIEVLRGPQGTLYGRNATAGNINIITKKPTNELEASGEVLAGSYSRMSATGVVNVPVVPDRFMIRASGTYDNRDGYNENDNRVSSIENSDDADDLAFRLHTLFKASENVTLLISGRYHRIGGVGPGVAFQNLIENPNDLRVFSFDSQQSIDADVYGVTAQLDWAFSNMALTYVGGWNVDEVNRRVVDADQTTPVFSAQSNALFGPFSQWTEAFTHELRLASQSESRLGWILGLYDFDEKQTVFLNFQPNPGVQNLLFDQFDIGAKSKAAFGELSFQVSDTVELVGGGRYTDDEKHRNGTTTTIIGGTTIAGVSPNIGSVESTSTDWKVGLNWQANPDSLWYGSVTTGYKVGGFNDGVGAPYAPEEVTSYEIGAKQMLLGRRFMSNASVFYMDYTDLQVSASGIGPNGLPGLFTQNAGEATIKGGEIETMALIGDAARIDASIGYLDAKYDEYVTDDPSIPGTLLENLAGKDLMRAPDYTLNVGAEYRFQLGGTGTLTPRVHFHYEADSYLREFNKPVDHEDSFSRTDFVLTYRRGEDRFLAEAYVKNIEDEDVRTVLQNFPGHGLQYSLDAPRTYGVRVGFKM